MAIEEMMTTFIHTCNPNLFTFQVLGKQYKNERLYWSLFNGNENVVGSVKFCPFCGEKLDAI